MLFQKAGDNEGAARMMDTLKRLADEAKALHGVIAQARDEGHV